MYTDVYIISDPGIQEPVAPVRAEPPRGFRRAISLKPGYPDVHVVYSQYLAMMNRPEEALEEARIGASLETV